MLTSNYSSPEYGALTPITSRMMKKQLKTSQRINHMERSDIGPDDNHKDGPMEIQGVHNDMLPNWDADNGMTGDSHNNRTFDGD